MGGLVSTVVVTGRIPQPGIDLLRAAGHHVLDWDEPTPISRDELLRRVAGADVVVSLLTERIDGELLPPREVLVGAPLCDPSTGEALQPRRATAPDELERANRFRRLWTLYQQSQDLIQVGAYESGSSRDLDQAIKLRPALEAYLRQDMHAPAPYAECREALRRLLGA